MHIGIEGHSSSPFPVIFLSSFIQMGIDDGRNASFYITMSEKGWRIEILSAGFFLNEQNIFSFSFSLTCLGQLTEW